MPEAAPRLVFNPLGSSLDDQQLVQEFARHLECVDFFVWQCHSVPLSTACMRSPSHSMQLTAIELPSALYRGPSGH